MASFLLVLLVTLMAAGAQADVVTFGRMVQDATGRLSPLYYPFYGCYCGLGGRGWPVDEIDWCCQRHDCCYGTLMKAGCAPLRQDYNYFYINGDIICDDEDLNRCARASCECDREIALCLRKFDDRYNMKNNFNFRRKKCWGNQPPCEIAQDSHYMN